MLLIELHSNRLGGKNTRLDPPLSGNYVLVFKQILNQHDAARNTTPGGQKKTTRERERRRQRRRASSRAPLPPPSAFFLSRRRLGSYHSQGLLIGRRKPQQRGTAAVVELSKYQAYPPCVGSITLFSCGRGDRRAGGKIGLCDRHGIFRGATAGARCCAMLWSAWSRLLPRSPPKGDSRVIAWVVVVDRAQTKADGLLGGR